MDKKIIVIDGNSLLFRAYYATAYGDSSAIMRTKSGLPTNAIFAFANMLCKILQSFKGGESIFVGFDTDKETFRKEEFADYKANRAPCPEDLKPQFPVSRELCGALGIVYFERHGIEADDICGTIAKEAAKEGYEVLVYTSDRDYLQLIEPHIKVSLLKVGLSNMELMDEAAMQEKYGLKPLQIIDYKGLRGDDSDNLPGIPGIGDKTAVKLIQQYGSFEAIMAAKDTIPGKLGENIRTHEEDGRKSFELAKMKLDVDLPFKISDLLYQGYDFKSVNDFAQKYELKQFLSRLPISLKKGASVEENKEVKIISSFQGIDLKSTLGLALDIDYSSYHSEELLGLAISNGGDLYYEKHEDMEKDETLKKALADPKISKAVYDGKATIYALARLGIKIDGIDDDLLLAGYLLDSTVSSNPTLVYSSFGVDITVAEEEGVSLFETLHPQGTGKMAFYAAALVEKAHKSLQSVDAYDLYAKVEMPLMKVLAQMELEGFPLNKAELLAFGKDFSAKKEAAQKEIYAEAKEEFNLNSPKQVAEVLYNHMGLKGPSDQSTSVEALESLKDENPIIAKILEYRKYAKLMGTYIDGLAPHIQADGKIHSYFNQAQTSTGRLSSSSPNLQNISVRDEEGKQIRQAFHYEDNDTYLMSLDYGQIELRIMAALSGCKAYQEVFATDRDVHSETARKIFHVEEVTPLQRRRAKAVNFAIIYGTTVYGLADQIGGTPKEAAQIIKSFYAAYPEVGAFLNATIHDAETKGYVTTMFGRRRYLRDVNDPNYAKREAARRAALNAPVQGSAADLIKIAMTKISTFLASGAYKTKMVLQIHDELIFAGPKDELLALQKPLSDLMTHAVELPVKLTVECGIGKTWFDAKD
jgi:DNA polymerase-1